MKKKTLWLVLASILLAGLLFYLYRSKSKLAVTPEAQQQIDKARQR